MDTAGESISFGSLQVTNFNANGGSTVLGDITNLGFSFIEYSAAAGGTDSGTVLGQTWTDINGDGSAPYTDAGDTDFLGHDPENNGVSLTLANGGTAPTAFTTAYVDGSWRINSVSVSFDAATIPEPSRFMLIGLGAMALGLRRRR